MGKTWDRRPRRDAPHGRARNKLFTARECCRTHSAERHAGTCRRDPVMCGVKAAFDYEREAIKHAGEIAAETRAPWRAYRCPWCGLYHLTTTQAGERP
jgi:hypothetical protein